MFFVLNQGYMFRLKFSHLQALWSKHVALIKNKKDCADVYCVTLMELQAHRDAFIQNNCSLFHHCSVRGRVEGVVVILLYINMDRMYFVP